MRKSKVECDVFYYKGSYLLEQPPETKVTNRYFVDGVGLVAELKKKDVYVELICILICVVNTILLIIYPSLSTTVHVPSEFNYYDGTLYVNIVSDKENTASVQVRLLNEDYTLEPGERLYTVMIDTPPEEVEVFIKSSFLIFDKTTECISRVKTVY